MFEKDLYMSTQRRFRESKGGRGDIQLQWLLISLRVCRISMSLLASADQQIERWREALLWTYFVAHLGTLDGPDIMGQRARLQLQQDLALGPAASSTITVSRGQRMTMSDMQNVWAQTGLKAPLATEMLFCEAAPVTTLSGEVRPADQLVASLDGHLPSIQKPGLPPSSSDQ